MSKRFKYTWFTLSFLFGLTINEINLHFVKKENPLNIELNEKSTMHGYMVYNVDHVWYLPQIKNMLAGNGYTLDPANPELKVRRTPVYPFFYGLHYILFGEEKSFFFLRYTQLLLLSLASVLLGRAVFNFTKNLRWAKLCTILFAFSPFIFIFAYHTITEGLTPFLIVLSTWTFSRYHATRNNKALVLTGICIGLAVLNRPLTGLLLPAFLLSLIETPVLSFTRIKSLTQKCVYVILPFILTLLPWTIRNYFATGGELVVLEKIYYEDPMDLGRGHLYFRNWISCWANPANVSGEEFSNSLRKSIRKGNETNDSLIDSFIEALPAYAFQGYSKEEVRTALHQLKDCFVEKQHRIDKDPGISVHDLAQTTCEDEVKASFSGLIDKFKRSSALRYYGITPLSVAGGCIFQSNSMFFGSLNPPDRQFSFFQKVIKGIMYLLNVSLFASFLLFFFLTGQRTLKIIIAAFILSTFLSLLYILFRHLEARYLLPVYPFLYISLAGVLDKMLERSVPGWRVSHP